MERQNNDVDKIHFAGRDQIVAPMQLFECGLPNNSEHEVNKAKALMTSAAGEMGFTKHQGWKLQRYTDDGNIKWRLEANFII